MDLERMVLIDKFADRSTCSQTDRPSQSRSAQTGAPSLCFLFFFIGTTNRLHFNSPNRESYGHMGMPRASTYRDCVDRRGVAGENSSSASEHDLEARGETAVGWLTGDDI